MGTETADRTAPVFELGDEHRRVGARQSMRSRFTPITRRRLVASHHTTRAEEWLDDGVNARPNSSYFGWVQSAADAGYADGGAFGVAASSIHILNKVLYATFT